jgi:hypothetical protein
MEWRLRSVSRVQTDICTPIITTPEVEHRGEGPAAGEFADNNASCVVPNKSLIGGSDPSLPLCFPSCSEPLSPSPRPVLSDHAMMAGRPAYCGRPNLCHAAIGRPRAFVALILSPRIAFAVRSVLILIPFSVDASSPSPRGDGTDTNGGPLLLFWYSKHAPAAGPNAMPYTYPVGGRVPRKGMAHNGPQSLSAAAVPRSPLSTSLSPSRTHDARDIDATGRRRDQARAHRLVESKGDRFCRGHGHPDRDIVTSPLAAASSSPSTSR